MNINDIKDTILNWEYLDEKKSNEYLTICDKLNIRISTIEETVEMSFDKLDINAWFYAALDSIFRKYSQMILDEIDEYKRPNVYELVRTYLEDLDNNFAPFINYLDTWFSNTFDEFDFELRKDIKIILKKIR